MSFLEETVLLGAQYNSAYEGSPKVCTSNSVKLFGAFPLCLTLLSFPSSMLPNLISQKDLFATLPLYRKSRVPGNIPPYLNMTKAFSGTVWLSILTTMLALSVVFTITYHVYVKHIPHLAGTLTSPFDFVLLTFSSIIEPDPLPWFRGYSSGKVRNGVVKCSV